MNVRSLLRGKDPTRKWNEDIENYEDAAITHDRWATFWEYADAYLIGRLVLASRWAQGQRYRATESRSIANKMRHCIHRPIGAGAPDQRGTMRFPMGVDERGRTVYSITSLPGLYDRYPSYWDHDRTYRPGKSSPDVIIQALPSSSATDERLRRKHEILDAIMKRKISFGDPLVVRDEDVENDG